MIKDNQKYFNRLHVWLDMFITIISYIIAWWLRLVVFSDEGAGVLSQETYFGALLLIVPVYMVLYSVLNLYKSKRYSSTIREVFDIVRANSIGVLLFFVALYIINEPNFSRSMIFIFGSINTSLMILMRSFIRMGLRNVRKKGYNRKYILLVG